MAIENWSEHVVLVSLLDEPQTAEELATVAERVSSRRDCDVVVDCSAVDRMGCSSCRQLLELDDTLHAQGHQLVLCGTRDTSGHTFATPALAHLLRFTNDRFSALARLGFSG
jgi:anti-anti-sigma factor